MIKGCDEKSDVYSLGVCFYTLCYFCIPDESNMRKNFKKSNYSDELKNLIKGMIAQNEQFRTDLANVKKEFNKYYYQRYIKNSGIHSVTQCLLNYTNLRKTISSNSSASQNNSGNSKMINVSFILISIYTNTDIEINNFYLKKFISEQFKLNLRDNTDISPLRIVFWLINSLNHDLNTAKINLGEESSQITKVLNKKVKLEQNTNIKILYNQFKNAYKENYKSIIITDCLGVFKVTWTCLNCNTNYISFERFFSITFNIDNIKDANINILDLFRQHNQYSFEIGLKKFVSCTNCKKFTKHSVNKKFYNLPNNLVILFDRKGNNNNLEIELLKEIKFNNIIVENFSNSYTKYILVGIIYENDNLNENSKYVPLINENKKWYQYKYGKMKQEIDFDPVYKKISKNIISLFYYKFNPIESMLSFESVQDNNEINNQEEKIQTDLVFNPNIKNNNHNTEFSNDNVIINNMNKYINGQGMLQNNNMQNNNQHNINNNNQNNNQNNMSNMQNNIMNNNRNNNQNNLGIINQNQNRMSPIMDNINNPMSNLNSKIDSMTKELTNYLQNKIGSEQKLNHYQDEFNKLLLQQKEYESRIKIYYHLRK